MFGIFVNNENYVLRATSASDRDMFVDRGWRELTQEEITAAGIVDYEQYVSPLTATVNPDGSISFVPPSTAEIIIIKGASIKEEILALEAQQTDRRIREATLTDEGKLWLKNLNDQIVAKRAELAALK